MEALIFWDVSFRIELKVLWFEMNVLYFKLKIMIFEMKVWKKRGSNSLSTSAAGSDRRTVCASCVRQAYALGIIPISGVVRIYLLGLNFLVPINITHILCALVVCLYHTSSM
jgi:hypothetical protein